MYGDNPTPVLRDIANRNSCPADTILFQRIQKLVNFEIQRTSPGYPHWDGELNGLLRDLFLHALDIKPEPFDSADLIGIYECDNDKIHGIIDSIGFLHSCGPDEYIDMLIDSILP